MKISDRLKAIGDFINEDDKIIDIGCDHALLDIYLCEKYNKIKIIASDVHEGALNNAINNIEKTDFKDRIDLRLGDGLSIINADEINTVVISGMGFNTIKEILSNDIFIYDDDHYGLINSKKTNNKYNSISYTDNGIYIASINNSFGLINSDGTVILPLIYDVIKYFKLDKYYIAYTSTQTLLDKNGNKIHVFSNNEDIIQYKNNMTVVKSDNYILYDKEFKEIVSSKEKIFILDDNKIILENYLIDLNLEYINFNYMYELTINYSNNELKYCFDNMKDLCEFLNQIELINNDYNKKLKELNNQVKNIYKQINGIENEKITSVNKKILSLKGKQIK